MELLHSSDFWFGLAVLLFHQGSRFAELDAIGPGDRPPEAHRLSDLRASDFVKPQTYATALIGYLTLVAAIFFVTCLIPTSVVQGWTRLFSDHGGIFTLFPGQGPDGIFSLPDKAPTQTAADALPWPLYIAAAYMGLSQSGIPIFSAIVRVQRRAVHWLIGIPKTVVDSSVGFSSRLLADASDDVVRDLLRRLTGNAWTARIDPYADIVYYRNEIDRLGLSSTEGLAEALGGSRREAERAVRALIFSAAIATSREGGTRALRRLAADLGLTEDAVPPNVAGPFILVAFTTIAFLWVLMPLAGAEDTFWPRTYAAAGMFVAAMSSVFFAVGLTLWLRPAPALKDGGQASIWNVGWAVLERCWTVLLAVLLVDIAFGYLLLLIEAGPGPRLAPKIAEYYQQVGPTGGPRPGFGWSYIAAYLPFSLLHAAIVAIACYAVLIRGYVVVNDLRLGRLSSHAILLVLLAAAGSALYGIARVKGYGGEVGSHLGYIALITLLRVIAVLLGLLAANLYYGSHGRSAPRAPAAQGPAPPMGPALVSPLRAAPPPAAVGR